MSVSCDVYHVLEWSRARWKAFFNHAPIVGTVGNTLQALPFPLHLRPSALRLGFLGSRMPCASPSSTHPSTQPSFREAWLFGGVGGVPRVGSYKVSSHPSCHLVGEGGGVIRLLPSRGLAQQESLVLAAPSLVAFSVSAGCDHRSRSREIGESTEDCSCSRSSRSSPSRGQDSCEGCRCARSQSKGSRDQSHESWSRGRKHSRHDSSHSPSTRVLSRQSRSRSSDCDRSRRVRSRFRNDRSRSRRLRSR